MKFDQVKEKKEEKKHYSQKNIKESLSLNHIKSIKRYNNVALFLMNDGIKGDLRLLSTLASYSDIATSWTIRITYIKNKYHISVAPHNDIDKSKITLNIYDLIEQKFGKNEIDYRGTLHYAVVKTPQTRLAQNIINYIIEKVKDNKIDGIENIDVDSKFNLQESSLPYKLFDFSGEKENKKSYNKYIEILETLRIHDLKDSEKRRILLILGKLKSGDNIPSDDFDYIHKISKTYLSDKERIHIAIKYMN